MPSIPIDFVTCSGGLQKGNVMRAASDIPAIAEMTKFGRRFVCWSYQERKGNETKVPMRADGNGFASSADPATWASYEECDAVVAQFDGIGVMLGDLGNGFHLVGIDLDNSLENGELRPWAQELVGDLNTYTEISPSGTGLKLFGLVSSLPQMTSKKLVIRAAPGELHNEQIEIFATGRYFTVTGDHLAGTPDTLNEISDAFERVARQLAEAARSRNREAVGSPLPCFVDTSNLPERLATLIQVDPKLQESWSTGRKLASGSDSTASGFDWSLALYLAICTDDETIALALRHYPHGQIGSGKLTGAEAKRRLSRCIEGARTHREHMAGDRERNLSDDGLALQMGELWAGDARFVKSWGKWLFWNGFHWKVDETLQHQARTRAFLRDKGDEIVRWAEATAADGEDKSKKITAARRTAKGLRAANKIASIASLAQSNECQVATSAQWDADPFALNTPGGIVDLRTGILGPPDPAAYMTKLTATAPSALGTPAPIWMAFLNRIFRTTPEIIPFLQRVVGYALTGSNREHVLILAWGQGANGKSTFFNTISRLMGGYAKIAPADLLLSSMNERHPTELAGLRGARFVTAQELAAGKQWDEPKLKRLTGGDPIEARFMRQDYFTYEPQFTLALAGNHKPSFRGVDEAIRRRVLLVPFVEVIPPEERDPDLPEKLQAEWPAILRWAIEGALMWQSDGLNPPDVVRAASNDYLASEDFFGQWLEDRCIPDLGVRFTATQDLYNSFQNWCSGSGISPWSKRAFSKALDERGFESARGTGGTRGFKGIRLGVHATVGHGQ